jgi:uncharacterized protein YndB with AHSA1/START domain
MKFDQQIKASRSSVFAALLDPADIAVWKVPDGMTCEVHAFEAREGGRFRVSLTYDGTESGKTAEHTDTYHGYFAEIVRDSRVVEITEFETEDPKLTGEMVITTTLEDSNEGTLVTMEFAHLPVGVSREDNETGTRMSLSKLARLVSRSSSLSPSRSSQATGCTSASSGRYSGRLRGWR